MITRLRRKESVSLVGTHTDTLTLTERQTKRTDGLAGEMRGMCMCVCVCVCRRRVWCALELRKHWQTERELQFTRRELARRPEEERNPIQNQAQQQRTRERKERIHAEARRELSIQIGFCPLFNKSNTNRVSSWLERAI